MRGGDAGTVGNVTLENRDNNEKRRRVQVPYDKKPDITSYVGTKTNDLREILGETQYIATNLFGEYENTFNEVHYFKAMAGLNYEQSLAGITGNAGRRRSWWLVIGGLVMMALGLLIYMTPIANGVIYLVVPLCLALVMLIPRSFEAVE